MNRTEQIDKIMESSEKIMNDDTNLKVLGIVAAIADVLISKGLITEHELDELINKMSADLMQSNLKELRKMLEAKTDTELMLHTMLGGMSE